MFTATAALLAGVGVAAVLRGPRATAPAADDAAVEDMCSHAKKSFLIDKEEHARLLLTQFWLEWGLCQHFFEFGDKVREFVVDSI